MTTAVSVRSKWLREIEKSVEQATNPGLPSLTPLAPVERILNKMESWLDKDPFDVRVDWELWVQGLSTQRKMDPKKLSPLAQLLAHEQFPPSIKRRAIAITQRIEARDDEWVSSDAPHKHYGNLPLSIWLLSSDVPDVVAFVQQHQERPAESPWSGPSPLTTEAWGRACARWLVDPLTYQTHRTVRRQVGVTQRLALFDASVANGWISADLLHTHVWGEDLKKKNVVQNLFPFPTHGEHMGSLPEVLAAMDQPGGLFERWRSQRNDWSTWESPVTATSIWRSLLINPNPDLLLSALNADPQALQRAVPCGRWLKGLDVPHASAQQMMSVGLFMERNVDIEGIPPHSVRTYAGRAFYTDDLAIAMKKSPEQAASLVAWWNDPAPLLRTSLEMVAHHLLPAVLKSVDDVGNVWQRRMNVIVEGWVLREKLPSQASPVVRPRSRL